MKTHLFSASPSAISDLANRINMHWQKATQSIIETAQLCAQANEELSASEKRVLFKQLSFSHSTFSKLSKIGEDNRLLEDNINKHLPASHSCLYIISQMNDETLDKGIEEGVITTKAKRATLLEWKEAHENNLGNQPAEQTHGIRETYFLAEIRSDANITDVQIEEINKVLEKITELYGVHITTALDQYHERCKRVISRNLEREEAELRRLARAAIKRTITATIKRKGFEKKKMSFVKKMYALGFREDEVGIEATADVELIKSALMYAGIEDEFETLRQKAERAGNEQPPEPPYKFKIGQRTPPHVYEMDIVKREIEIGGLETLRPAKERRKKFEGFK